MREVQCLALTDDEVVLGGHVRFSGSPLLQAAVVRAKVESPAHEEPGQGQDKKTGAATAPPSERAL